MLINAKLIKETKSCWVFAAGTKGHDDHQTFYLKKNQIEAAGIDPQKGVTIEVTERRKAAIINEDFERAVCEAEKQMEV